MAAFAGQLAIKESRKRTGRINESAFAAATPVKPTLTSGSAVYRLDAAALCTRTPLQTDRCCSDSGPSFLAQNGQESMLLTEPPWMPLSACSFGGFRGQKTTLINSKPTYRKTDPIPTGAPAVCSEDCTDPCTVPRNLGLRSDCVSWLKPAAERRWSTGQRPGHHSSALSTCTPQHWRERNKTRGFTVKVPQTFAEEWRCWLKLVGGGYLSYFRVVSLESLSPAQRILNFSSPRGFCERSSLVVIPLLRAAAR